jgi:hypothetical protein
MSDFKVNGSTPEEGKLKLGSSDIKRIYKGNVWSWPPADNSYTPTSPETNFHFLTNVKQTTNSAQGLPEGFGIYDTLGNNVAPNNSFGTLPTFQNYHDANFTHYKFVATEELDRHVLVAASADYRYMLAKGHLKNGFYYYGGYNYFPSYIGYHYLGNTVDSLLFSNDYGQTWNDLPITLNPLNTDEYFNGYTTFEMSDTGQVIIVEYETTYGPVSTFSPYVNIINFGPITHAVQESDKIVLISRDYGQTFEQLNNQLSTDDSYKTLVPVFSQSIDDHFLVGNKTSFDSIKMSSTGKYILVGHNYRSSGSNSRYIRKFYLSSNFGHSFTYLNDIIENQLLQNPSYQSSFQNSFDKILDITISGNGKVLYFSTEDYIDIYSLDYGNTWDFISSPRGINNTRNTALDFEGNNLFSIDSIFSQSTPHSTYVFNWQNKPELDPKRTEIESFQHSPNYNKEFLISQTGKFALTRLANLDNQNNNFYFFKNFGNNNIKGSVLPSARSYLRPVRILNI